MWSNLLLKNVARPDYQDTEFGDYNIVIRNCTDGPIMFAV